MKKKTPDPKPSYEAAMGREGMRLTPQRRHVYEVLMENRDHPTAIEVFLRTQKRMSTISLATVYNCLETMVENGLVKAVNVNRNPTRFCANLKEHGHFHCSECGRTSDIEFTDSGDSSYWQLPKGYVVTQQDISLRGICDRCASASKLS